MATRALSDGWFRIESFPRGRETDARVGSPQCSKARPSTHPFHPPFSHFARRFVPLRPPIHALVFPSRLGPPPYPMGEETPMGMGGWDEGFGRGWCDAMDTTGMEPTTWPLEAMERDTEDEDESEGWSGGDETQPLYVHDEDERKTTPRTKEPTNAKRSEAHTSHVDVRSVGKGRSVPTKGRGDEGRARSKRSARIPTGPSAHFPHKDRRRGSSCTWSERKRSNVRWRRRVPRKQGFDERGNSA